MDHGQTKRDAPPAPIASLPDLREISVDRSLPLQARTRAFLRAVGNPYLFRVEDTVVKVSFTPNGKPFRDALADGLRRGFL